MIIFVSYFEYNCILREGGRPTTATADERLVIIVVVLIILAAVYFVWSKKQKEQRTEHLRGKFGPEYDRTLEGAGGQKEAEADLQRRAEQRERLDIRPLSPAV